MAKTAHLLGAAEEDDCPPWPAQATVPSLFL